EAVSFGKQVRLITEIDIHNLDYCRDLIWRRIQLKHLGDISGLLIIGEQTFVETVAFEELTTARQLLTSSSETVVHHQKKIFNELWNIGVPAAVRIKSIDTGETSAKHELLQNPASVEETYTQTLESANSQILLMLPTAKAF